MGGAPRTGIDRAAYTCARLAEIGGRLCSPYNDSFLTEYQSLAPGIPPDRQIAFDGLGNPLCANGAFYDVCSSIPSAPCPMPCPSGAGALAGTGFEAGGATQWLPIEAPTIGGETIVLDFALFDVSDSAVDTTVLLDAFHFNGKPPCCFPQ